MRHFILSSIAITSFMFTGCGGQSDVKVTEVAQAKAGLNGGTAFPLPEKLGYAEVVVERTKPGQPVTVAVYFLDETGTKPLVKPPGAVKATLQLPTDPEPKAVSFTSKEKTGGKAAIGPRFATAPGPYDFDELKGELQVTLDGKDVTVPFALR